MKCLKNVVKRLTKIILNNIQVDAYSIIKNSCYISYLQTVFEENTIIDLLKNIGHFELLLDSIRIMPNDFIPLFTENINGKNLQMVLKNFYLDCRKYLKTIKKATKNVKNNDDNRETNLLQNFVDFYKKTK